MTNKISDLSKEINKFIRKEKFNYVKRDRKITLNDSLLYKLLLTKKGNTQYNVTANINMTNNKNIPKEIWWRIFFILFDSLNKIDIPKMYKICRQPSFCKVNVRSVRSEEAFCKLM